MVTNNKWNHLKVHALNIKTNMIKDSFEEFIFEHYYGYTKLEQQLSQEYTVNHPRWQINEVKDYTVDCDFSSMYGREFAFLSSHLPYSVIIAEGSPVTVDWNRKTF